MTGSASVTAYLTASPAKDAIEFYKKAFGAEEIYRLTDDDGIIGHAEMKIGETTLMLSDEYLEHGAIAPTTLKGTSVAFVLELPDVDAAFQRAVDAGARVSRPIADAPYGRGGWLFDPFGHRWNVMTSNPDFNPDEMKDPATWDTTAAKA